MNKITINGESHNVTQSIEESEKLAAAHFGVSPKEVYGTTYGEFSMSVQHGAGNYGVQITDHYMLWEFWKGSSKALRYTVAMYNMTTMRGPDDLGENRITSEHNPKRQG